MKVFQHRMTLIPAFFLLLLQAVHAQAVYQFQNPVLVSGTSLQTGARYKFSDVKAGVDALVTIVAQNGGITLTDIDNFSTGFQEAFQPSIHIASNAGGYVEFKFDFTEAATGLPMVQDLIPVTCTNMEGYTFGDGVLHIQDQVQFFPGYYNYLVTGGKIDVANPSDWVMIKNLSGQRFASFDTASKEYMATVVNKNVSGFLLRIGAVNSSVTGSMTCNQGVYFKTFNYGHLTTLPNRTMLSFSGTKKSNGIELKGTLSASHSYDQLIIERAVAPNVFGFIGKMDITGVGSSPFHFTYLDMNPENGINYYRVRLVGTQTNIQEISNTLMVKMENSQKNLDLINTVIQAANPVLTIYSSGFKEAEIQLVDYSGHNINHTIARLNSGINNITLPGFHAARGFAVIIVRTNNNTISQQVMVY